jgi:hypothetical protein
MCSVWTESKEYMFDNDVSSRNQAVNIENKPQPDSDKGTYLVAYDCCS